MIAFAKSLSSADRNMELSAALTAEEMELYERIPQFCDFVPSESFDDPATEEKLFGHGARHIEVAGWIHFPDAQDDVDMKASGRTALGSEDEITMFLRYNFARSRLVRLMKTQKRRRTVERARQMLLWYGRAMAARATIVRANMALVLAMAKRTRIPNADFGELISEGNMALLRSVEKFDVARGFKFSTYACRSILKSFSRLATKTARYRKYFPTEYDPELEKSDHEERRHDDQADYSLDALKEVLDANKAGLTKVERIVVNHRFALGSGGKGKTLEQVGRVVGLTNERVRQIQNLALAKLRAVINDDYLTV